MIEIRKEEVVDLLAKKRWNKSISASIERELKEKQSLTEQYWKLLYYDFDFSRPQNVYDALINATYHSYPVKNDSDFLELKDLLSNYYLYSEVSKDDFDYWSKSFFKEFEALYVNIPPADRYWILNDDPFRKDAIISNANNGFTFLSWSLID